MGGGGFALSRSMFVSKCDHCASVFLLLLFVFVFVPCCRQSKEQLGTLLVYQRSWNSGPRKRYMYHVPKVRYCRRIDRPRTKR